MSRCVHAGLCLASVVDVRRLLCWSGTPKDVRASNGNSRLTPSLFKLQGAICAEARAGQLAQLGRAAHAVRSRLCRVQLVLAL